MDLAGSAPGQVLRTVGRRIQGISRRCDLPLEPSIGGNLVSPEASVDHGIVCLPAKPA